MAARVVLDSYNGQIFPFALRAALSACFVSMPILRLIITIECESA